MSEPTEPMARIGNTMTEQAARTLWCPHARVAVAMRNGGGSTEFFGVGGCNRGPMSEQVATMGTDAPLNPHSARCITSECAAWRWDMEAFEDAIERYEDSFNIGGITSREKPVCRGYCGLAGKP